MPRSGPTSSGTRACWVDRPPALFSHAVEESQASRACMRKPGGRRFRVREPEPQVTMNKTLDFDPCGIEVSARTLVV